MIIALLLALGLQAGSATMPGGFAHGDWRGRCYRDGNLGGVPKALCRATLPGAVTVELERDAAQLAIVVRVGGCAIDPAAGYIGAAMLKSPARAKLLRVMIDEQIKMATKQCGSAVAKPRLADVDLVALLGETDGLEPIR